jgi:ribosomal protein S18 acetylase RimI-like enzyme
VIRRGEPADADAIGRLLHDFNLEYEQESPPPVVIAERLRELMASGDTVVLLAGAGPDGLALMRFRPSIWIEKLECYLGELYVVPDRRGQGLGRALMEKVFEVAREQGAGHIELNTSDDDVAARALYEKLGFTNREGKPDGPVMYYYEREL